MGKLLWEPIAVGTMRLSNRLVMPPMVTDYGDEDGTVSDKMVAYYARRARGGVGMVVVEATSVDSRHILSQYQLRIDSDSYLPGLARLAGAIKEGGARPAIQLCHPGRLVSAALAKVTPVAPSPIPDPVPGAPQPRELTIPEIEELVERFAAAACRAQKAGFDAVELHGAHGTLICQFLSPFSNQRRDGYGGRVEGRTRFAREALAAVKARCGRDYPLWVRLSAQEFVEGGLTIEDTRVIARLLAEAGADAISVSAGNQVSRMWSTQPVFLPRGVLTPYSAEIKREVKVPVMVAGRINDPDFAEEVLSQGQADLICMGRALLSDPDLPRKAREGVGDIRRCITCMSCSYYRPRGGIVCLLNPEVGREGVAETPAARPRKVLVVGSSPGALEAARVARLRGHQVTLWEEKAKIEGRWSWLLRGFLSRQVKALQELGVRLELGKATSPQAVAREKPDAVIVAPRAREVAPAFPGVGQPNVVSAKAALEEGKGVGKAAAVVGGGNIAAEVAFFLANRGAAVTIVSPGEGLGEGLEERTARAGLQELQSRGVSFIPQAQVVRLQGDRLTLRTPKGEESQRADTVVAALGAEGDDSLAGALQGRVREVHRLSFCPSPLSAYASLREGAELARKL